MNTKVNSIYLLALKAMTDAEVLKYSYVILPTENLNRLQKIPLLPKIGNALTEHFSLKTVNHIWFSAMSGCRFGMGKSVPCPCLMTCAGQSASL